MDFGINRKGFKTIDYLMVLVALMTSGFPPFMSYRYLNLLFLPFLLSKTNIEWSLSKSKAWQAVLVLLLFLIIQLIFHHVTFIGLLEAILFYATIILEGLYLRDKFVEIFCSQITLFSFISLLFFIPIILSPSVHSQLLALKSVIPQMYNQAWDDVTSNPGTNLYVVFIPEAVSYFNGLYRNCGPFYEPGLFASYASMALVFNIAFNRKLFTIRNVILVLAILSTMSTGGYMELILIILYVAFTRRSKIFRYGFILSLSFLIPWIYRLDFVGEKMVSNYEAGSYNAYSRFGAAVYHWEKIKESPIIGYHGGAMPTTALDSVMNDFNGLMISPNGVTWVFVFFGIPLGILFYRYVIKSIKCAIPYPLKTWEIIAIFLVILSCAFSQTITTMPIFFLFTAISITYNNTNSQYESRCN